MQNALNGSSFRDTFEMTDARGVHKWVDVLGVPYADFDGKILGLRGTIQDVTEKKSAENQLRKSEIEVREIMSAIEQSAIVATTDKFGKILTVNPEFCRVTGYRADELISHDYLMIIADQENEASINKRGVLSNQGKRGVEKCAFGPNPVKR